ncbi:hypothetical protein B9H04_06760 [Halorubrum ezzemoulense DSM 17463]|uniref:Uncharacterized protein n=1 Tax=Halorubrum ezzemoulense DSM 17463 TaxID=1121945 RepID=A0A1X4H8L8_HALEZ|nr:hypothetical protein B9H04_06760 [Halorubrum ezzemoulense DSM 17463]
MSQGQFTLGVGCVNLGYAFQYLWDHNDLDADQLDRLKYIANRHGMRFLSGDGTDDWKIYDTGEGPIDPYCTVETGIRMLTGVFGSAFGDAMPCFAA